MSAMHEVLKAALTKIAAETELDPDTQRRLDDLNANSTAAARGGGGVMGAAIGANVYDNKNNRLIDQVHAANRAPVPNVRGKVVTSPGAEALKKLERHQAPFRKGGYVVGGAAAGVTAAEAINRWLLNRNKK